jgi:hypothetical protein
MKRVAVFALIALALLAFSGRFAYAQGKTATVQLKAQNGSNESGTATITEMGNNEIQVVVNLSNGTTVAQPAHIHKGTCANLNPTPQYPLTSLVDGKSTTTVKGTNLTDLTSEPYAVNVHKSATEASTYVSCGDITADLVSSGSSSSSGGAGTMPATGGGDSTPLILVLVLFGLGLVVGGAKVGRSKA